MTPVDIVLPSFVSGDTWEGLQIGPVLFGSTQPLVALASCRLYFRSAATGDLAYGFKSEATAGFGSITLTNAVTWVITIPPQSLPLSAGAYKWDFETTDAAGIIRTLYKGVLIVVQDQSYD